ncbi:hypothetical protein J3E61_003343 [Mycobacterium sp. OAE908]
MGFALHGDGLSGLTAKIQVLEREDGRFAAAELNLNAADQ